MPETLVPHLAAACPLFEAERTPDQLSLAAMVWHCMEPRRRHRRFPGSVAFTRDRVRIIWGSELRMQRVLAGKHFSVLNGSNLDGFAAAFAMSEELFAGLSACLRSMDAERLVDTDTGKLARSRGAIGPFRAGTETASSWRGCSPAAATPINVAALLAHAAEIPAPDALSIAVLAKLARNSRVPGAVPIRYLERSTGRLSANGPSLQNTERSLRNIALGGNWDHDLANCHYTILQRHAQVIGVPTPAVDWYVREKLEVRQVIARDAHITQEQAKECLIITIYGGRRSLREQDAFAAAVGVAAARRLFDSPTFMALHADVGRARRAILDAWEVTPGGWQVNAMNIRILASEPPARRLAHLSQGLEAAALKTVVSRLGAGVLLCMHDGWVVRHALAQDEWSANIAEVTGVRFGIENKYLDVPSEDHLRHFREPSVQQAVIDRILQENQRLGAHPLEDGGTKGHSLPPLSLLPSGQIAKPFPRGLVLTQRPLWNFAP